MTVDKLLSLVFGEGFHSVLGLVARLCQNRICAFSAESGPRYNCDFHSIAHQFSPILAQSVCNYLFANQNIMLDTIKNC